MYVCVCVLVCMCGPVLQYVISIICTALFEIDHSVIIVIYSI